MQDQIEVPGYQKDCPNFLARGNQRQIDVGVEIAQDFFAAERLQPLATSGRHQSGGCSYLFSGQPRIVHKKAKDLEIVILAFGFSPYQKVR